MSSSSSSSSSSSAPNNKKRAFGAVIRTLNDVTNVGNSANDATNSTITNGIIGSSSGNNGGNSNNSNDNTKKIIIQHIPNLDNEAAAATILQRIHSEFGTLINKRGWNIKSITEMCCCGDGLDHCCSSTSSRATQQQQHRKRTPLKIMPNNVLGYNRSSFIKYSNTNKSSSHDIHLRLRHPSTHVLYDYESIASTMCHELAHCVRGPHDVQFYKAMDEIEEQYHIYLVKGVILDKDGFPMGSQGMTLGRNNNTNSGSATTATNNKAAINKIMAEAAEARRSKSGSQNGLTTCGGYVLGGSSGDGNTKMKDPRDAARIAAERRLDDAKYCLPSNEIIELLGDDDTDDEYDDDVKLVDDELLDVKPKAKTKKADEKDSTIIDLTLDDSLDDSFTTSTTIMTNPNLGKAKKRIMADMIQSSSSTTSHASASPQYDDNDASWSCKQCTLFNPSTILVCMACHSERPCHKSVLEHATELHKADAIDYIKEREVQISKETFGGFNIYGEKKK